jgi:hypothetical protein
MPRQRAKGTEPLQLAKSRAARAGHTAVSAWARWAQLRLHGDGLDADRHEPVGHPFNVAGEGLERLDRLVAQLRRNGNDMESRSDVDARRAVMNDR